MEAVEQLAAEAGLEVPKPSPEAAEAERRAARPGLACWTRRSGLPAPAAAAGGPRGAGLFARTRPDRRDDPPIRARLGGRGAGRAGRRAGARGDRAGAADGGRPAARAARTAGRGGELFFNRVMFPIRDRRGRVDQLRRPHAGRRPAEIPERAGNRAVLQAAHALRAGPRARGGARRRGGRRGRGLHGRDRAAPGGVRRRGGAARHRADRGAAGGAVAALAGADAVFRRRRRRRPCRGARRRSGPAAFGARPHACASRRCRRARTPTRWCAAGRAAFPACWTPPARSPRRCTTCCARTAVSERRNSARRSAPGWSGAAARFRTGPGRRIPPRVARTASSPQAGGRGGQASVRPGQVARAERRPPRPSHRPRRARSDADRERRARCVSDRHSAAPSRSAARRGRGLLAFALPPPLAGCAHALLD